MAPRKTAAGDKALKAPATKKSADKVIKRPARGYHKFRNGLLNVTPKGGEKELVKQNERSPLLRMPAEIRNEIWKLVLGGKMYRSRRSYKFQPSPKEPKDATALLRTCRQIYSETAIMPLALTVFSAPSVRQAKLSLKKFKLQQRKQITILQFDIRSPELVSQLSEFYFMADKFVPAHSLPALQELRVHVCAAQDPFMTREKTEEAVHEYLKPSIRETSVEVKVHQTSRPWSDYWNS